MTSRRAPEPRAERAQHRLGDVHRLARAPLQQLHDVAEQHQPLDAVERGEQRLERLGAAQDVAAETGAEVQIGDDEGGHGRAGWWHSGGSLTKVRDMSAAGAKRAGDRAAQGGGWRSGGRRVAERWWRGRAARAAGDRAARAAGDRAAGLAGGGASGLAGDGAAGRAGDRAPGGGRRGHPAGAVVQPQRHAAHRRAERRVPGAGRPLGASRVLWEIGARRDRPARPARAARPRLRLPQPPRPEARARRARRRCSPAQAGQARAHGAPHRRRARRARAARPPQRRARLIAARLR